MSEFKATLCRLCLKNITDKDFQVIDGAIRDILDVLLLKLKFEGENQEVICNSCKRTLKIALDFKSMCLNNNNTIIPHVDCEKMSQVDLREVYIKENGNKNKTGISDNDKICRLCMHLIKGESRGIGEEEFEAIENFVPEMNITIIKDPVVCNPCFESLCTHNNFIKDCLAVDQRIMDTFESSANDSKTYASSSELFIKKEHLEREDFEINEMEMAIKTEYVDIKTEADEGSEAPLLHSNNETFKNRPIDKCNTIARKKNDGLGSPLYKCDKCIYETISKNRFTAHCVKHENVQMYKCDDCDYETKYKSTIARHILQHKDRSQVPMYKCESCTYKSTNKKNFIKHQLAHKDLPEVRLYSCNACDYKTKYRSSIRNHELTHKDSSEVEIYKCNACDYESKYKSSVIRHQLIHKNPAELPMYGCNDCDYKTICKRYIRHHVLIHKDPFQVQIYKCDTCDFESRNKRHFTRHQLMHEDPSHMPMYRCNDCDYKTMCKRNIRHHAIKHRDPLQVQMYKCDTCDYESTYKNSVTRHQVLHKTPSEVLMYSCDSCDFKTKYKWRLTSHATKHGSLFKI